MGYSNKLDEVLSADALLLGAVTYQIFAERTPLFYQHVNPYGRFTLDLTQRLPLSLTNIA